MPEDNPYQINGAAAAIVPYPALSFLLTTDRALGSTNPAIPEGSVNRELHKLLQNIGAVASQFISMMSMTYGTSAGTAPAQGTVVLPLPGAPITPVNGNFHQVYFSNFVVTYVYDGVEGEWVERFRATKVAQVVSLYRATVNVAIGNGETDVSIPIPTVTDNLLAFDFEMSDLRLVYINNLDENAPIVGAVAGFQDGGAVVRVALTEAAPDDNDYEAIAVFERLVIS